MTEILNETPLIKFQRNFLSDAQCVEIIDYFKGSLVPGQIVGHDGKNSVNIYHRNASTAYTKTKDDIEFINEIYNKVSDFTGFDKSRFEQLTVSNYNTGQEFKLHQDYFITMDTPEHILETNERCRGGGNRISTIIIYLNTVIEGGETFFPWVSIKIKPECGKLVQFNYDYNDWEPNIRSQHVSMPVLQGEKWIITIWVREQSVYTDVLDYRTFELESNIHSRVVDTEFTLECGIDSDKKNLHVCLPGNNDIQNAIAVGFTAGMDSSLLLYLLGMLNSYQTIPYKLMPVLVTSTECLDPLTIKEDVPRIQLMLDYIRKHVPGTNISDLTILSAPRHSPRKLQVEHGLSRYMKEDHHLFDHLRFWNIKYIYLGTNQYPTDNDPRWDNINATRPRSKSPQWVQPFFDLQKYHIADAIIKLELFDIFEIIGACSLDHKSTKDTCVAFACNERRWALEKLDKLDIFDKYFKLKRNGHEK